MAVEAAFGSLLLHRTSYTAIMHTVVCVVTATSAASVGNLCPVLASSIDMLPVHQAVRILR